MYELSYTTLLRRSAMNNHEQKRYWLVPLTQSQHETEEEKSIHREDENIRTAKTLKYIPEFILTEYDARKPLQQLTEKLIVRLLKDEEGFTPILVIFGGKDLLDSRAFTLKVGEFITDFNLDMKKSEFVRFKEYLHAKAKRKLIYSIHVRVFKMTNLPTKTAIFVFSGKNSYLFQR